MRPKGANASSTPESVPSCTTEIMKWHVFYVAAFFLKNLRILKVRMSKACGKKTKLYVRPDLQFSTRSYRMNSACTHNFLIAGTRERRGFPVLTTLVSFRPLKCCSNARLNVDLVSRKLQPPVIPERAYLPNTSQDLEPCTPICL